MQLLVMGPVRMPTKVLNISTRKSPLWRKKPVNSSVWDSWGAMVLAVVYGLVYNCAGQFLRDASMIVLVAQDQDADLWCAPGSELVRLEDRLL